LGTAAVQIGFFLKLDVWKEDYLDCGGEAGSADTALAAHSRRLRGIDSALFSAILEFSSKLDGCFFQALQHEKTLAKAASSAGVKI